MSLLSEAAVLDALRSVQDPDLHKDIVALGFIKNLRIKSPTHELEDVGGAQYHAAAEFLHEKRKRPSGTTAYEGDTGVGRWHNQFRDRLIKVDIADDIGHREVNQGRQW